MNKPLSEVVMDSALTVASGEKMLLIAWNGSLTFNVYSLVTGENVDAFMVMIPPVDNAEAEEIALDWLTNVYV